jgi:hypothetical protein
MTIDLPQDLEQELAAEAATLHLPLPEYVLRLLTTARANSDVPRTGAELVEYWKSQQLIGSRDDITDSQQHARDIRHDVERRQGS